MIRLDSLSMTRFRGVREGTLHGLTDVNLLIGRNNSGKTTVLEAVMRVMADRFGGAVHLLGRNVHQFWSQIRQESGPFSREMWYRSDTTEPIVLAAQLRCGRDAEGGTFALVTRMTAPAVGPQLETTASQGGFPPEFPQFVSGVALFRPQEAFNTDIERKLWPNLLSNRRDKVLTRTLNHVFGLNTEALQLLPNGQFMVLFEEHGLPLDVLGDGSRAALRTLMVLTLMKNSLLLLEEPECHQHPGSLLRFAEALCRLAREQEVQLIISTHSAECVGAFLKAASAVGSEGAVFHLSLTEGHQEARRLDPEAVETLQSTGVDVRFLDLYA